MKKELMMELTMVVVMVIQLEQLLVAEKVNLWAVVMVIQMVPMMELK